MATQVVLYDYDFPAGSLKIAGTAVTPTAAELNQVAGATVTPAELTKLNGVTAGTVALSKVVVAGADGSLNFGAATATFIKKGTSGTPATTGTVGDSAIAIYQNPTKTSGAKNYGIVMQCYLAPTDTFTVQGSGLYTIRGVAGVKGSTTFKGSANQGYIAGVQGKLDNLGVIGDNNSGGIYACAGLSQVSGAGTYGTDAQLYGHWIDFQAGMGTPPTTCHMLNMTNNSGKTLTNGIYLYGGNGVTNLLALSTCGGMVGAKVDADIAYAHYRKVNVTIDGLPGYIFVEMAA